MLAVAAAVLAGRGAGAATPAPAPASNGALEAIAAQIVAGLGAVPSTTMVVAAPLASDTPVTKADELAERLAALVAGRIGASARVHPQPVQLGTARAAAAKSGALLYLQPEIARGTLRATADVYAAQSNAWDRVRNPVPAPSAHAFAGAQVDPEVRAFLPPILLEQAGIDKATHDEGDVLAAACGDLDGDGGNELALVSRSRVALGRLRGGKFVPFAVAPWSALAPRAPSPLREPIATCAIAASPTGEPALYAGITDRGGVRLPADLSAHAALVGLPVGVGDTAACATPSPGTGALEGLLSGCADATAQQVLFAPPAPRFDAFAAAPVAARDGAPRTVFAARAPGGHLRVRLGSDDPAAPARTVEGAGAELAVGDLDQDGVPEIVASRDTTGQDDVITITSWSGTGEPVERRKLPAPGGVRALGVCPPELRAAPALVAVVGGEVWLLR
jgi:hypothetical protein